MWLVVQIRSFKVEKICQRLTEEWKQPPLLALLLPTAASDEALTALDALSDRGVLNPSRHNIGALMFECCVSAWLNVYGIAVEVAGGASLVCLPKDRSFCGDPVLWAGGVPMDPEVGSMV